MSSVRTGSRYPPHLLLAVIAGPFPPSICSPGVRFAVNCKREGLLWTRGIAPRVFPTTPSGQIVLGSRRRARRNGADGDGARLPIELALDALDGADADVMLGGELADAGAALLQGVPDFALDGDRDRWPAETLALGASTSKAGVNSVLDDAALELGEDAHHLEQRLAAGRRGVHALLMEVQVDLEGMQLSQERDQVLQRPAKSINRPGHDDVELAPGRALAQGVESGSPISTLGAADALVAIDVEDLAAHSVGDLPERALLVLGRLPIPRTDADVQGGAAHGDSPTDEANASSRRWSANH